MRKQVSIWGLGSVDADREGEVSTRQPAIPVERQPGVSQRVLHRLVLVVRLARNVVEREQKMMAVVQLGRQREFNLVLELRVPEKRIFTGNFKFQ